MKLSQVVSKTRKPRNVVDLSIIASIVLTVLGAVRVYLPSPNQSPEK